MNKLFKSESNAFSITNLVLKPIYPLISEKLN